MQALVRESVKSAASTDTPREMIPASLLNRPRTPALTVRVVPTRRPKRPRGFDQREHVLLRNPDAERVAGVTRLGAFTERLQVHAHDLTFSLIDCEAVVSRFKPSKPFSISRRASSNMGQPS